jgi:hypothetical protein
VMTTAVACAETRKRSSIESEGTSKNAVANSAISSPEKISS